MKREIVSLDCSYADGGGCGVFLLLFILLLVVLLLLLLLLFQPLLLLLLWACLRVWRAAARGGVFSNEIKWGRANLRVAELRSLRSLRLRLGGRASWWVDGRTCNLTAGSASPRPWRADGLAGKRRRERVI